MRVVVDADRLGPALAPQLPTAVLEIADQLFLLGVDRDGRLSAPPGALDGIVDVLELRVAIGMLATFAGLGVGLQAEAEVLEQAADQAAAGAKSLLGKGRRQMPVAAADPPQVGLRIAARGRRHQVQQGLA